MDNIDIYELSDVDTYDADSFLKGFQDTPTNEDFNTDDENVNEAEMAYFTKHLGISTVIHTTVPIEYPATSPEGIATIFNVQGLKKPMDLLNDVS